MQDDPAARPGMSVISARRPATVVVAGHVCVDLVPALRRLPSLDAGSLTEVGPLVIQPGGCVANAGSALAALGTQVRLVADVGEGPLATLLVSLLARSGADVAGLRATRSSTSYSIVVESPGHDRTFWHHVGANAEFDGTIVDLEGAHLLHLGYPSILPAMLAAHGEPLRDLFRRARAGRVTTSLDCAVISEPDRDSRAWWTEALAATLPLVDVFTPSVDDLASATGRAIPDGPDAIVAEARRLVGMGVALAAVSAGASGMALASGSAERFALGGLALARLGGEWFDQALWVPAEALEAPASTTGAGDAASAGLLHGLLEGYGPRAALELAVDTATRRILGRAIAQPQPRDHGAR